LTDTSNRMWAYNWSLNRQILNGVST